MEWSERMNAAVEYIEENLAGEIDFNEAANRALCSTYHFQRMFFVLNGITPVEYARRRRLTLAARELMSTDQKVIDIATKYGYDSPNAFTRAFRNLHGVTPQAAREPGVTLTAFPRISFRIVKQGGNDVDYKIIEKPAFEVIGKLKREATSGPTERKLVIDPDTWNKNWFGIWEEFGRTKHGEELEKITRGKPGPVTGAVYLSVCEVSDKVEEYTYTIGVEKPGTEVPEGYGVIRIPASTWAVFEAVGPFPETINKMQDRVFLEWFPSTGYEHAGTPELEIYPPGDRSSKEYRCQYWLPVLKK